MKKQSVGQFLKFGLVGVSNTLINYLVYVIFVALGAHYAVANTFGFLISVLNAYFWGSRFVFKEDKTKEKRVWWQVLLKTYASYALGFVLNTLLLAFWIDLVHVGQYFGFVGSAAGAFSNIFPFLPEQMSDDEISKITAPVLNMFVTIPINFVINKFWAYRQKNKTEENRREEPHS